MLLVQVLCAAELLGSEQTAQPAGFGMCPVGKDVLGLIWGLFNTF